MTELPQPTRDAIYDLYKRRGDASPMRAYLGASEIGEECRRRLWYSFRHAKKIQFEGRILRLFEAGHREEDRVIQNLKDVGVEVHEKDPETGAQFRFTAHAGHFSGGMDGAGLGFPEAPKTWHLIEAKTANKHNFEQLKKKGVREHYPKHFAQMQVYMHLGELTRAFYICVCKDNDEIYTERVTYEKKTAIALLNKAGLIIESDHAPDKISENPSFWKCKFCDYQDLCQFETETPAKNCRTCVHATARIDQSGWKCGRNLPLSESCTEHLFNPDLLPWATPLDGDPTHIRYRSNLNKNEFVNAAGTAFDSDIVQLPMWSSEEIAKTVPECVGDHATELIRSGLGGRTDEAKRLSDAGG